MKGSKIRPVNRIILVSSQSDSFHLGIISQKGIKYRNIHFPFWILTISVFVITIMPSLIQDGMFIDGIQYAAISKNLANSLGTFWCPYLSENWSAMGSECFLEHPPLVYAIQSVFFKVFGDSMYTERIYCLFTAIISTIIIGMIWNQINKANKEIRKLSWLPVLFWISMPIVFRSYQMNVQENTMGIFILGAVYFVIRGLKIEKLSYLNFALGGVFIFLSTLSKGVPGLFPLVSVLIYRLAGGRIKFRKLLLYSFILLLIPILLYIVVLLNDNANESLSFYFSARLLERVLNNPTVNSHLHIIFRLFIDLIPTFIISLIAYFLYRNKPFLNENGDYKTHVLFFLIVGIVGSIPLAFTLVQRDFYLAPSLPFYAIGLALYFAPLANGLINKFSQNAYFFNILRILSIALLFGGLIYTGFMAGNAERDKDILHDTYIIGEEIGEGTRVRLDTRQGDNWNFELYLIRYFNISLGSPIKDTKYIICRKNDNPPEDKSFNLVPLQTMTYRLYKRQY